MALLHHFHGGGDILLRQLRKAGKRVHHNGNVGLEGGGLGAEHQILRHQQRIGVQQQQHAHDDQNIAQAETGLKTAENMEFLSLHRPSPPFFRGLLIP